MLPAARNARLVVIAQANITVECGLGFSKPIGAAFHLLFCRSVFLANLLRFGRFCRYHGAL
jgi:hypothetical protein